MKTKKKTIIISVVILLILACLIFSVVALGKLIEGSGILDSIRYGTSSFSEMAELQRAITERFETDGTKVSFLNNEILALELVNLKYDEEKYGVGEIAKEIAKFAKDNYKDMSKIKGIRVTITERNKLAILTTNRSWTFSFGIDDFE